MSCGKLLDLPTCLTFPRFDLLFSPCVVVNPFVVSFVAMLQSHEMTMDNPNDDDPDEPPTVHVRRVIVVEEEIEHRDDWATSDAKEQLKMGILANRIGGWRPVQVCHDPERHHLHKHHRHNDFRTNLRNLRNKLAKNLEAAARDKSAMKKFKTGHKNKRVHVWHQSQAQKHLRSVMFDDEEKKIANMTLDQIHKSSVLFKPWTKDEFGNCLKAEKKRHWKKRNSNEHHERMLIVQGKIDG